MKINAETKLAAILKHHPGALEAIVSIHPHYKKLRNPVLRKLMAARTSIRQAAKMGGCSPHEFFTKLAELGFEIDPGEGEKTIAVTPLPSFMTDLVQDKVITLDVRPVLNSGIDPLSIILDKLKTLNDDQVLRIINTFEPTPLMELLKKQGYASFSKANENGVVETWFKKTAPGKTIDLHVKDNASKGWDDLMLQFKNHLVEIDVRKLEMPQPMMNILEELNTLPGDHALFVHHKRIPVFLLPELKDRHFDYRAREIAEENVELLIFRT